MGGWLSYLWWGGDPDLRNPLSGLTRREVYAVQKSWAPVYADAANTGTELLKSEVRAAVGRKSSTQAATKKQIAYENYSYNNKFFRAYPDAKDFFKMLKNVPEEEFSGNIQFKAHVINLMSALNLAVVNLNQPEIVAAMMVKIGDSHKKRQIKEKNFHDLKEVIVKMFIEVLKLDNSTLGAWAKAVDFWYKNIFNSLNSTEVR